MQQLYVILIKISNSFFYTGKNFMPPGRISSIAANKKPAPLLERVFCDLSLINKA
jgi:hypothetical protein